MSLGFPMIPHRPGAEASKTCTDHLACPLIAFRTAAVQTVLVRLQGNRQPDMTGPDGPVQQRRQMNLAVRARREALSQKVKLARAQGEAGRNGIAARGLGWGGLLQDPRYPAALRIPFRDSIVGHAVFAYRLDSHGKVVSARNS